MLDQCSEARKSCKMSLNISQQEYIKLFVFANIEDEPLMQKKDALIIVTLSSVFLFVGILLNGRIFTLLAGRKNGIVIDKLMASNTVISSIGHSLVLMYYIASNILYPMSDYISIIGCLVSAHFLDTFIRFYNFCFPVAIAFLRYLFVVKNLWVRAQGMTTVANAVIACSILIPFVMTLSIQFPVSDEVHFAFNR